jgi:hypothetical protein
VQKSEKSGTSAAHGARLLLIGQRTVLARNHRAKRAAFQNEPT